jgi:hypothetical protein
MQRTAARGARELALGRGPTTGPGANGSPLPTIPSAACAVCGHSHDIMLIEIAIAAALAPLLALFFEWWDRRAVARRNALLARLSTDLAPAPPPRDEPVRDALGELDADAGEPNA